MTSPRLLLVALLPALACACGPDTPPRSAILITLDTTRADALGSYGAPAGITPALDALAAESIVFDAAYTVAPITLPSHASMLTGLYPPRHTLRDNGLWPLPESAATLAERAREAGCQTAAFLGAVVLDRGFGLDQGFDVYDVPARGARSSSHASERPATAVVAAALEWLRGRDAERPFFLWLHVFDPHGPYAPPPGFREGPAGSHPYLGEVAFTDHALGAFLDALRADGTLDEATLIVVADHGEALGERGEATHGTHVYESTMRVPLFLRRPGGEGGGVREPSVVSVVDVHPTLLEALGLAPEADIDGQSLLAPSADRGVYFESYSGYLSFGWSPIAGWLDADGKYVHSSAPELYDVQSDPGETENLVAARDPRPYRLAIAEVADRPTLDAAGATADAELLDELRGLGYAAVASGSSSALPHPLAPGDRPPPSETLREHAEFLRAMDLSNRGQAAEAEALLRGLLERNPRNDFARDLLAFNLQALGRTPEAVTVLEELLEGGPAWPDSWHNLGLCYRELGRVDEAVRALERAVELAPRDPKNLRALAATLRGAGRDASDVEARLARLDGGD